MQCHDVEVRWVGGCADSTRCYNSFNSAYTSIQWLLYYKAHSLLPEKYGLKFKVIDLNEGIVILQIYR